MSDVLSEQFGNHTGEALYVAQAKVGGLGVASGLATVIANEYTPPKVLPDFRHEGDDFKVLIGDQEKVQFVQNETERFERAFQGILGLYNSFMEKAKQDLELAEARATAKGLTGKPLEEAIHSAKMGVDCLEVEIITLNDPSTLEGVQGLIQSGKTAEMALHLHFQGNIDGFSEMKDQPEIAKFMHDLEQQRKMIADLLSGKERRSFDHLGSGRVVVAKTFPSLSDIGALIDESGKPRVNLIVFGKGSFLSHAAIKAQTHGIILAQVAPDVLDHIQEDTNIVVSGVDDKILVAPFPKGIARYAAQAQDVARQKEGLETYSKVQKTVRTLNEQTISFHANHELVSADVLAAANPVSYGLVRSECLFEHIDPEDVTENGWYEGFKSVLTGTNSAGEYYKPATIRTIDTAGDKGKPRSDEERKAYEAPILKRQFAALLRLKQELKNAPDGKDYSGMMKVMVPMIESAEHMHNVQNEMNILAQQKQLDSIRLGCMVEIPSLLAELEDIDTEFMSVGSNDLTHKLLNVDRYGGESNNLYDPTKKAVLLALQAVARAGDQRGIDVSICGDMASDPRYAILAVGAGIRNLSCKIPQIPLIKKIMERADTNDLARLVDNLVHEPMREKREEMITGALQKMGFSPKGFVDPNWQRDVTEYRPDGPSAEKI